MANVHEIAPVHAHLELQCLAMETCVHEIRGLLVAGNYARMIAREPDSGISPLHKSYLNVIIENTQRIKEVLSSLSWVAEHDQWSVGTVSPASLLREVGELSGLSSLCSTGCANGAPCIYADRDKLRDALLMLLSLGSTQSCTWTYAERVPAMVRITVVLHPIQTADGLQRNVEMPELSPSNLQARLEDVRHVVRGHGGTLSFESNENGVCEITVALPAAGAQSEVTCA